MFSLTHFFGVITGDREVQGRASQEAIQGEGHVQRWPPCGCSGLCTGTAALIIIAGSCVISAVMHYYPALCSATLMGLDGISFSLLGG